MEDDSGGERKRPAKSADEEAMEALLLGDDKQRSIKKVAAGDVDRDPVAEDYKALPVEDFGAALLRGYGWDGKLRGEVKQVSKHANLTGLGAKSVKGAEDLGAWSQKSNKDSSGSRSKPARLDDYRREEEKKRQRRDERHGDSSYRRERERERERERDRR
jgi:hypothetical protein